ncbi:MAG: peptide ABC transporter substrate-binding protein [Proteobacteria bacterium]|nr:MAG: peptide ABC transporter substrate-binding protein [Pseudomonadota bacterium]
MSEIDRLQKQLASGKITRREFMSRMTAIGAAAAAPGALFSGSAMAAPKKGGHFKLGLGQGSTTDSLDPATYLDTYMQTMGNAIYSYLAVVDNEGNAVGDLAESIEPSPDATVWRAKIRKGVEFHNGKSVTPEDVIASYQYHMSEDSQSAAKSLLAAVTDLKADGDTVVFTLSEGNADFPYIMTDYHIGIMPSKDGKVADPNSGVGSGGYIVESFDPGVKSILKRNPNFYNDDIAHFDSVESLVIKDVAARTTALTTGEIHAMNRCDLKTVHLLKRNRDLQVLQVTGTQHYTMPMITTQAPYDDNNVRMALKYGIDREAIVQTVLRGYGQVGNDHPIGPSQKYFNKDLPQRSYDPDKAKFYLKEAGLDSLTIDLSAADAAFAGAVDTAVLFKEHAAKAGIEVNVVREPDDGYWSNVWMKKPFCMCYWGGRPTEDWMFTTAYAESASWNDTYWKHDRFNELLLSARAELDENKRRQSYYEMQEIVSNEGGVIVPMFASYVMATSKEIGMPELGANWDMDGLRAIVRWWMA